MEGSCTRMLQMKSSPPIYRIKWAQSDQVGRAVIVVLDVLLHAGSPCSTGELRRLHQGPPGSPRQSDLHFTTPDCLITLTKFEIYAQCASQLYRYSTVQVQSEHL